MNNQRRKQIQKALNLLAEAKDILEEVMNAEQEAFDNLPEGLQCSEKGEQMEDNIYNLEEFIDFLGDTDTLETM